jgi:hypothetical protein
LHEAAGSTISRVCQLGFGEAHAGGVRSSSFCSRSPASTSSLPYILVCLGIDQCPPACHVVRATRCSPLPCTMLALFFLRAYLGFKGPTASSGSRTTEGTDLGSLRHDSSCVGLRQAGRSHFVLHTRSEGCAAEARGIGYQRFDQKIGDEALKLSHRLSSPCRSSHPSALSDHRRRTWSALMRPVPGTRGPATRRHGPSGPSCFASGQGRYGWASNVQTPEPLRSSSRFEDTRYVAPPLGFDTPMPHVLASSCPFLA